MRTYADTSFLAKLVAPEAGSEAVVAEVRRLDHPRLFYLPLHALELTNAIHQRAFHLRRTAPKRGRAFIPRERDAAMARIDRWLARGWLLEVDLDLTDAITRARALSALHTERLGCRAFDVLHVACALALGSERFLTADATQGTLARAAGLVTRVIGRTED
jgi:predicted nucleic acid-binding protein